MTAFVLFSMMVTGGVSSAVILIAMVRPRENETWLGSFFRLIVLSPLLMLSLGQGGFASIYFIERILRP